MMVDKYAVKEYVANLIGKEYVIPTIGVWNNVNEIDFDSLPDQFVLKSTHDSHGIVICRDKKKLDIPSAKKKSLTTPSPICKIVPCDVRTSVSISPGSLFPNIRAEFT